jgi:hypothetical protein
MVESFLDAVFHCIDNPTFLLDSKDNTVLVCNLRLRELLGTDASGRLCYQAFYGFNQPCANCPVSSKAAQGDSLSCNSAVPPGSGPCKPAYLSGFDGKWLLVPDIAEKSTK